MPHQTRLSAVRPGPAGAAAAPRRLVAIPGPAWELAQIGAMLQVVALVLLATVTASIALVIGRRLAGALAEPLAPLGAVACGLLLAAWAVAAHRWLARREQGREVGAA